MKKILFILTLALFFSCGSENEIQQVKNTNLFFGDSIAEDGAVDAYKLISTMGLSDSMQIKVSGTITDICQTKGCWMNVDLGYGKTMRVSFKDYAFFVPKDASGKIVVIDGYAKFDTTSIQELRHFAEDAGKLKEEIEKIVAPEIEFSYEARGVIIKND